MSGETMQLSDAIYADNIKNDPYHRNRLAIALNLLKKHTELRGANVFDFGCGEGTFMRTLAAEGATVAGSDPSETLIDLAPEHAAVGSVETLEALPPNSIEILVVLNVLGYVPQDQQARFWNAASAITKPGGFMLQGNANARVAAGKSYHFMADPRTFPQTLKFYGFEEIDRDFHRYRLFPWTRKRTGKRDVIEIAELKRIPMFLKAMRSTGYYSISQRLTDMPLSAG